MSDNSSLESLMPELSSDLIGTFNEFLELIKRYNTKINLVAKSTIAKAGSKHFTDSVRGVESVKDQFIKEKPVLDFGAGNGFPGIIAALLLPDTPLILVERDLRKAEFLKLAIDHLKIKNAQVHSGSVAELENGSCFNVISRAMAPIPKFLLEARHVMASGGSVFLFKGEHWSTEYSAMPAQLFDFWDVDLFSQYELPENEGFRYIVRCTRLQSP